MAVKESFMTALRDRAYPWLYTQLSLSSWPADWQRQLEDGLAWGRRVETHGRGPGSLEDDATAGLDYVVLTGERIRQRLPWLYDWYVDPATAELMSQLAGERVVPSPDLVSGLNVNILRGPGGRYEWHTDSQPYTLVVFASSVPEAEGGQLLVGDMVSPLVVPCQAGTAVLFDGEAVPHAVSALTTGRVRVSLPITFLPYGGYLRRAPGINDYLFSEEAGRP